MIRESHNPESQYTSILALRRLHPFHFYRKYMTSPNLTNPFFDQPVLNSPHKGQSRCWELDEKGEPTQEVKESRRSAEFITPNPKPKKRGKMGTDLVV